MMKYFFSFFLIIVTLCVCKAQNKVDGLKPIQKHSFGIQAGLTLLENPFVLYPGINFSYSKTIAGERRHRLALLYQLGGIFLPEIETKFLLSAAAQYKYISKKRFEANIFLGLNNQLRMLAYNRYQFEDNILKSKGRLLYQLGPVVGLNLGYKVVKKDKFSFSPFLGISLTKLNKNYAPSLFTGYKPNFSFGVTFNK